MPKTKGLAFTLAAVLWSSVVAHATDLRPGQYEATLQVSIMGELEPPEQDEQCFTADDVERFDGWIALHLGETCSIADRTESDGRVTFTIPCADDVVPVTRRAELTTTSDSFVVVLKTMHEPGDEVDSVLTMRGKRIGECARR
jgi:hypothetical protein